MKFHTKILLTLSLVIGIGPVSAQSTFQNKAITLNRFLQRQHYQPVVWNDTSSSTLFSQWIYTLDRRKLLFTQSDLQQLLPLKERLGEELAGKSWKFFDKSVALYRVRLKQVDSIVKAITAKPFDFKAVESITWPMENFAADSKELSQRWKLYLKLMTLRHIAEEYGDSLETPAGFLSLVKEHEAEARNFISEDEAGSFEDEEAGTNFISKLEDEYLNAIAWCYDPHSSYMNTKAHDEFKAMTSASQFSTGMDFEVDDEGGLTVDYLEPGGSAWRSGKIHKGDVIIKVRIKGKDKKVEDLSEKEWMESFGESAATNSL